MVGNAFTVEVAKLEELSAKLAQVTAVGRQWCVDVDRLAQDLRDQWQGEAWEEYIAEHRQWVVEVKQMNRDCRILQKLADYARACYVEGLAKNEALWAQAGI